MAGCSYNKQCPNSLSQLLNKPVRQNQFSKVICICTLILYLFLLTFLPYLYCCILASFKLWPDSLSEVLIQGVWQNQFLLGFPICIFGSVILYFHCCIWCCIYICYKPCPNSPSEALIQAVSQNQFSLHSRHKSSATFSAQIWQNFSPILILG